VRPVITIEKQRGEDGVIITKLKMDVFWATTQKTSIFILTAVRTSNPNYEILSDDE
jgi:hypothetical protein